MMTRSAVAKRIGKSVATVRRAEGVLLHPTTDHRGVHHFNSEEVAVLVRRIEREPGFLSRVLGGPSSLRQRHQEPFLARRSVSDVHRLQHRAELNKGRAENARLRERLVEAVELLEDREDSRRRL